MIVKSIMLIVIGLGLLSGCVTEDKIIENEKQEASVIDYEKISDTQLEELHLTAEKYPHDFGIEELKEYDTIIESANSIEGAMENAEKEIINKYSRMLEIQVFKETEYFYIIYAKWEVQSNDDWQAYDKYLICFKNMVYDNVNEIMYIKDKNQVKQIMDYKHYITTKNTGGSKVLKSDIIETEENYEYVIYMINVTYGDWGLQDEIRLRKASYFINKENGKIELINDDVIKTIRIDGVNTNL